MTDEEWDCLPPAIRCKIYTRGEAMLGPAIYNMARELFYEFADRAMQGIEKERELDEARYKEFLAQRHNPRAV